MFLNLYNPVYSKKKKKLTHKLLTQRQIYKPKFGRPEFLVSLLTNF